MKLLAERWMRVGLRVVLLLAAEAFGDCVTAQTPPSTSSFTVNSSDNGEFDIAKVAIQGAVADNEELLKQNLLLREQVQSLTLSLTQARVEADQASAENRSLNLRIEALGLAGVNRDRAKLEQRLVQALGDLRQAQTEVGGYREVLIGLSESVISLLKSASGFSPGDRMAVESRLRAANEVLGLENAGVAKASAVQPTLTSARVISIKPELGLVVGNVGSASGVRIGMPFKVFDGDRLIAVVRVVDVRKNICGALIQELLSEDSPVKVGCRLKVDAE